MGTRVTPVAGSFEWIRNTSDTELERNITELTLGIMNAEQLLTEFLTERDRRAATR